MRNDIRWKKTRQEGEKEIDKEFIQNGFVFSDSRTLLYFYCKRGADSSDNPTINRPGVWNELREEYASELPCTDRDSFRKRISTELD